MSNKIESGGMSESSGIELKGDFVRLVWLIEKLRRRDGGCTMNDLIFECKERFCGLEFIKESKMENNPQAPSATVDVDALAKKIIQSISELVYVNIGDNAPLRKDVEKKVSDILSRTLSQKRYTPKQVIKLLEDVTGIAYSEEDAQHILDQFDSEGK